MEELSRQYKVAVFGPRNESIAGVTHPVSENIIVTIPELALSLSVLDVPGHTRGHIAYYSARQQWLFCGDTLFGAGCGRLFEGTPMQMAASLDKLAALPDDTQVFCAHEYTLSNLRFACEVESGNAALMTRVAEEQAKRHRHQPTIPSTIGLEKSTNPFLRFREPSIAQHLIAIGRAQSLEPVAIFTALRNWKDVYR